MRAALGTRSALLGLCVVLSIAWTASIATADNKPATADSWITFLSHRTGHNLLYRMRADGSACEPIFGGVIEQAAGIGPGAQLYREPHWTWQSPDRQHFVSWAQDQIHPSEASHLRPLFHLYLGRVDGKGTPRLVAPLSAEAAAWSPDSKRFAFTVVAADVEPGTGQNKVMKNSRIYIVAIDGSSDELIFEQPGYWQPEDWSPDGKRLLIYHDQNVDARRIRTDVTELDLARVALNQNKAVPWQPWQKAMVHALEPILPEASPVYAHGCRYSPNGEFIATTAIRKQATFGDWKPLNFELGIITRKDGSYRKVVSYEGGLRGPICWSADGKQLLFSRPLELGDRRENVSNSDPKAINQETGLGLWIINVDGTSERMLTTGWSPDWR